MALSSLHEGIIQFLYGHLNYLLKCLVHLCKLMTVVILEHALDTYWHIALRAKVLHHFISMFPAGVVLIKQRWGRPCTKLIPASLNRWEEPRVCLWLWIYLYLRELRTPKYLDRGLRVVPAIVVLTYGQKCLTRIVILE